MSDAMDSAHSKHPIDPERSMKPLLGKLVQEAVHLALIDCCLADEMDGIIEREGVDAWLARGDQVKTEWARDIHAIPSAHLARMDPLALAQCVAVRLLGSGGWMVGGVYAGNATARELLDATFERPDQSHVDELAFDVLRAMEDAHEIRFTDEREDDEDA
jgi:hypothetical protein